MSLSTPVASAASGNELASASWPATGAHVNAAAAWKGWLASCSATKLPPPETARMAALIACAAEAESASAQCASSAARGEMAPDENAVSSSPRFSGSPDTRPASTVPLATAASISGMWVMYTTSQSPPSSALGGSRCCTEW